MNDVIMAMLEVVGFLVAIIGAFSIENGGTKALVVFIVGIVMCIPWAVHEMKGEYDEL